MLYNVTSTSYTRR
jgi:hypothetical protein